MSSTPSRLSAEIMKVVSKGTRSFAARANVSRPGFSTKSILLRINSLGWRTSRNRSSVAAISSSRPRRASIRRPARSASCATPHAVVTMARSSRRRGAKMPGVSMNTSCAGPSIAMPRTSARVVCTLWLTIETLVPTSALMSVDLPALGAPISAMKPQRVAGAAGSAGSPIRAVRRHALPRQHGGGGRLLGRALRAAAPFGRFALGKLDRDAELGAVVGARPPDFAVARGGHAARLRPFLQYGLRIAQRARRLEHAVLPEALDQRGRRGVAAVDEHRPDQRLAHVGEDRRAPVPARQDFRIAEPHGGTEVDGAGHVRAGFPAHQRGEPAR